ncbi:unnamed protein product [Clonostachys chloroleuca]|uniref:Uncharacterized protein n=1 Tax=Clonostachys chloroleuca TaxID=1926264 RepID=A0AA35LS24_9HYPO|nr:unnamed protein product [Clonostachys chloroleuca]
MVLEVKIVLGCIVIGVGRELGSDGINLLDKGVDTRLLPEPSHCDLVGAPEVGQLSVAETKSLGLQEKVGGAGDVGGAVALELAEEPLVDLGHLPDLVDAVSLVHGVCNGKETLVRGSLELIVELHQGRGRAESDVVEVDRSDRLLDGFLERPTDAHDLTDTLHRRAELGGHTGELLEIPPGHLDNDVVERRFEAGAGLLGDGVLDLLQRDTETKLGGDEGQRVAGSLGGKGRRSRETGVDLDDAVLPREGVQRILNVALTDDAQMPDDIDCCSAEHVVVLIRQSLGGGNDNGVTGGTDNHRETNILDAFHGFCDVVGGGGLGTLLANGLHASGKELTILSRDDGINGGTENLDTELLKLILELDTDLESGLTTKGNVDGVGALVLDDLADELSVDREEVHLVGETLGGLNGGNVGVDEHRVDAFLLQSLDGLTTGVIELAGLTDAQATTAQDKDLLDRDTGVEALVLLNGATGEANWLLKERRVLGAEFSISGTRRALGVELHTEVRLVNVHDTLVAAIVGVDKELLPALGEAGSINLETVVLGGDVALSGHHARAGDVVASISELHLLCLGSGGSGEELVSQANTKHWGLVLLHRGRDVLGGGVDNGRVTGTVGDEETIILVAGILHDVMVPGDHEDLDAALEEASELVVLHTHIDTQNPNDWSSWDPRLTLSDKILLVGVAPLDGLEAIERGVSMNKAVLSTIGQALLRKADLAKHATLFSELLCEGSGIDAVHGGDALLLEPGAQRRSGKEMRVVFAAIRGCDQTSNVDPGGLEVSWQVAQKLVKDLDRGNTVVSDQGECDDENLTLVGGVCNGFVVANHARLED